MRAMKEIAETTRRRFLASLALPVIALTQPFGTDKEKLPPALAWRKGGAPRGNLLHDD